MESILSKGLPGVSSEVELTGELEGSKKQHVVYVFDPEDEESYVLSGHKRADLAERAGRRELRRRSELSAPASQHLVFIVRPGTQMTEISLKRTGRFLVGCTIRGGSIRQVKLRK